MTIWFANNKNQQGDSMRKSIAISLLMLLASCAWVPARTDRVRNPETAILVAKTACKLTSEQERGRWSASYENGIWTAWYTEHPDWSATGESVLIHADTGIAETCKIVVTAS
jgi:hypothetical protein